MRTATLSALLLLAVGCGGSAATKSPSNTQPPTPDSPLSIEVSPPTATLQSSNGAGAAPVAFTALGHYKDGHTTDLSSQVTWSLADATIGSMAGGTFTAATTRGGLTTLSATSGSITGTAQLEVDYVATRLSVDDGSTAPANSAALFAAATPDSTLAPGVLYPLDGVTVPANLGQLEVQWTKPAAAADLFEIALVGKALDLRIYTNAPMTVGGRLSLQPAEWAAVSATLAGSSVQVQVTAMSSADPTHSGTGAAVSATIDSQSLSGGIYYWTPTNQGIMRRSFDDGTAAPTNFYSAADTGGRCIACHVLSRDGKKAAVSFDAGSGPSTVLDVATKTQLIPLDPPINFNFAAFSADGNKLVGSSQIAVPAGMLTVYDTSGGATSGTVLAQINPAAGTYASHPDWSADGKSIVFAQAPVTAWGSDFNFEQGSIVVVTDDGTGTFGNPKTIVASAGENNYYPSFSPDGKWILFNRAPSGSSYNNPDAAAYVVAADGSGSPIALGNANATGQLTDSWPRWSPFVQSYADGSTRLYFTFSSKRDYGIEIQQPTDIAMQRPQIWMAAFSPAAAKAGTDPSATPFWLPFQDINTNNHIAQWAQTIVPTVN